VTDRPAAPPEPDRAAPDRIVLRDHVVEAEIGAFQQERGIRQRLRVDLLAELAETPPGAVRDDVDAVLTYDVLADAVRDALAEGRVNLLETLAEGIAARVLAHPGVARVRVGVAKLDRLDGALGVEITRARDAAHAAVPEPPARPQARVIVLPEARLEDPDLPAALAALIGADPVILCVDAAPARTRVAVPAVQRRIDLLAFEQAAWRLAARDPRFVVVDSRTELDWGLRHGQTSVWAPSKMVVDARGDAPPAPLTMAELSVWLARRIGAQRIECAAGIAAALVPADMELCRVRLAAG